MLTRPTTRFIDAIAGHTERSLPHQNDDRTTTSSGKRIKREPFGLEVQTVQVNGLGGHQERG